MKFSVLLFCFVDGLLYMLAVDERNGERAQFLSALEQTPYRAITSAEVAASNSGPTAR